VAGLLASARPVLAQAPVNLSGTWVGNAGVEVVYSHNGGSLQGNAWGGRNDPNLRGSVNLSGGPMVFKGTYENSKGNLRGWGTLTITVCNANTMFVAFEGFVTDGRQSAPVRDSGYAYRR